MALDFTETLVIGISSRALFDLEKENEIFCSKGVNEYRQFQLDNEDKVLAPGTGFHLIKALLNLNKYSTDKKLVEVVVMSRNSADTGIRVSNSIRHHGLDITRSAYTGGESLAPFMEAFYVDLFLSKSETDVQEIIDSEKAAAALIYDMPKGYKPDEDTVRIAFDADAVIFSDESEHRYKTEGIESFHNHESKNQDIPLQEGPYAKLLKTLSKIQKEIPDNIDGKKPLRIAIVTARNSPSDVRIIKTLRDWKVNVDSTFFLGGLPKDKVLSAFRAHIFFDDQETHVKPASQVVPSCKVPYKSNSLMGTFNNGQLVIIGHERPSDIPVQKSSTIS